jgi:hypothetical protein
LWILFHAGNNIAKRSMRMPMRTCAEFRRLSEVLGAKAEKKNKTRARLIVDIKTAALATLFILIPN